MAVPHGVPTPLTPSSTCPSQSLSMPSQTSVDGPMNPRQRLLPQAFVPIRHWLGGLYCKPPGVPLGTHGVAGTLSSTTPSQSLSMPSQISVCGLFTHACQPPDTHVPTGTFWG